MSPLRKHSNFDNQTFFALHPMGNILEIDCMALIINELETIIFASGQVKGFSELTQDYM